MLSNFAQVALVIKHILLKINKIASNIVDAIYIQFKNNQCKSINRKNIPNNSERTHHVSASPTVHDVVMVYAAQFRDDAKFHVT